MYIVYHVSQSAFTTLTAQVSLKSDCEIHYLSIIHFQRQDIVPFLWPS